MFQRVGRFAPVPVAMLLAWMGACSDATSPSRFKGANDEGARGASAPIAGLVAAYGFDEQTGTAVPDASGNANNGTLSSGVSRTTSGKFGGALVFNRGYVSVPDAPTLDLANGMTLEAWVYPTAAPSGWSTAVMKEQAGGYVYSMYAAGPTTPTGEINIGTSQTGERITYGPASLPLNTWSHLATTYDGSTVRLYVNGAQVASQSVTGRITQSDGAVRIGGNQVWGEYFTGTIDEVRIYTRALSAGEVQADMTTPVSQAPTPDVTAPTLAISTPSSNGSFTTSDDSVNIGGTASDNVGVTQVTWVNSAGGSGIATGTTNWSIPGAALQVGTNTITVTARDAANNTATATITITRSGTSAVPGLVAAYGFNEASGTSALDGSGNGNNGTLGSGVARTSAGKFGGALTFSGNYVTVPHTASLNLTTGMTLEAWVYPTSNSGYGTAVLKEQSKQYVYTLYGSAPANPSGEINVGTTSSTERINTGPSPLPLNTWSHIASTYDGTMIRLYVNGTQVATKAATGSIMTSTGPLRIGGNAVWGEYFRGRIDEIRIYNRPLTAAEVATDMRTPVGGTTAPSDDVAPTLAITTPSSTGTYTTAANQVTIGGTSSDNVGVVQVRWANDRGGSGVATGTTTWSAANIPLQSGTNVITITAQDAANNTSNATLRVSTTSTAPVASQLTISTQPASSAQSGVVFARQPVIQLRDASGAAVNQSGVVVTAAINSGGGTLGGTLTATTNTSGVATFANLSITGTAGSRTLRFTSGSLSGVTSAAIDVAAPTPPPPPGGGEPIYDASADRMMYQDNMDRYTNLTAMGAGPYGTEPRIVPEDSPVWNGHAVDASRNQIIPGRSGNALRMAYSGRNQDGASFMTINMPSTPINSANYFTYYARITFSQPLQSQLAVKWFMIWHWNDSNTRTQFNTHDHLPCPTSQHGTYWQVWDQAETRCQGNQPVGPYFENLVNDNKWHRFTYAFRANTSKGSRDGFARMWIDGTKIIDVSAATVGVTPPGGEKPWCDWDDVDNLVANDRVSLLWWGGVQTSYVTAPWTYDIDDFSWWIR